MFILCALSVQLIPSDIPGALSSISKAYAGTITYIYDQLDRLVGVVDPSGDTAVFTYDAVGNVLSITRQPSTQVSILSFTPDRGPIGTTVTIHGTGFSVTASQNTVTFNGVPATVTSAAATQLTTTVPAGATTGPIAVVAPGGSATSGSSFTVTSASQGPPTITGFTPTIGTPGTEVTISGTNFDPTSANDRTAFNVSSSTVTSATSTSLATTVPPGTGSGRISVTTPMGTAQSSADFFIPPASYTAADVAVTGRVAVGASLGVTIGTPNKIGLIVFDGTASTRLRLSASNVTIASTVIRVDTPYGMSLATLVVGTGGGTLNLELPSTGTYTILVDPAGANTGSLTLKLDWAPDLKPTALTAPDAAVTQQSITVSWTVINQGNGATQPSWSDYVYLSADTSCCTGDTLVTTAFRSTSLAAGGSYTETKTVTVPNVPAGTYHLILRADHVNGVYEADDTNNQVAVPITISTPDLRATAFSAPGAAVTQQSITVSWTVTNQGNGATQPSWSDYVYLSADTSCCTGDTLVITAFRSTSVAAGGSYTETKTVTVPSVPAGTYYLILRPDHVNGVYEADETNNQPAAIPITISTPDLAALSLTAPSSARAGESISVSWTVINQGNGATQPSWLDYVYLSADTTCCTGDTLVTTAFRNTSVAAGGSYTETKTVTVPSVAAGNYHLILRADHGNGVYEADETNNQLVVPFTVSP